MSDRQYVYIIRHEHGYVKIGKAADPYQRWCSIKTGSPYELELWKVAKCSKSTLYQDYEHLEKYLHSEFEEYNVRGEWFDVDPAEVFQAMARAVESDSLAGYALYDVDDRMERYETLGRNVSEVF